MRPSIGITTFSDAKPRATYTSVSNHYIRSIFSAGGLPFALPVTTEKPEIEAYLDCIDGILFTGGIDVAPWRFGEEPGRHIGKFGFDRDENEFRLLEGALARGMPVFGICRGHQLINIALGGSVYQDMHAMRPGTAGHYPEDFPGDELYHSITVTDPGSVVAAALGSGRSMVNSFHHQSINRLAPGLTVTALSDDGIIEACEYAGSLNAGQGHGYLATVQFHPESLTLRYRRFLSLFEIFVGAAANFSSARSLTR